MAAFSYRERASGSMFTYLIRFPISAGTDVKTFSRYGCFAREENLPTDDRDVGSFLPEVTFFPVSSSIGHDSPTCGAGRDPAARFDHS